MAVFYTEVINSRRVLGLKEKGEFCTELLCFEKKKEDKISLLCKLLTKIVCNAVVGEGSK